jgi:hypothetical protein
MPRSMFLRAVSLPLCLVFDFIEWARDAILVHVFRRHKKLLHDTLGGSSLLEHARLIAIVAIRPTAHSEPFTLNLLKALAEHGFHTLIVCNALLSERQREMFRPCSERIIERAPIGRDFGCYQAGLKEVGLFVGGLPAACERLVLANDSMFYRSDTTDLISELMKLEGPWVTMFESYEKAYHAQSFFLLFAPAAFRLPEFKRFWKRYKPYSSRTHTIRKGEIGLSRVLTKANLVSNAYYSSTRIQQVVEAAGLDPLDVISLLPAHWELSWSHWTRDILDFAGLVMRIEEPRPAVQFVSQMLWRRLSRLTESRNPTHIAGLLLNCLAEAPLKRDICYRDTHSIAHVVRHANGFDAREIRAMEADLRSKGVYASLSNLKRMLYIRGRI